MRRAHWSVVVACMLAIALMRVALAGGGAFVPEDQIPRFSIPRLSKPPTIDGTINADEWREATKIMGMAFAHSNTFCNRPHTFYVAWDEQHLYIAGRAHIVPGHILYKQKREKYVTGVVFDDAFEFGVSMEGRNQLPGEAPSYFKFILNFLGCGEYMKMYPSIGQYLYNWRPELDIANKLHDTPQGRFWETEFVMDLDDLQMPVPNKPGDIIKILLAHDGKNPGWVWAHVPSATGYLVHTGFPRATLTADQPYVQVEDFGGLHDERVDLKSVICNPSDSPVRVNAVLQIRNEGQVARKDTKQVAVNEARTLVIPAHGSARFDVHQAFPGLDYRREGHPKNNNMQGVFDFQVRLTDKPAAAPIYTYALVFRKDAVKKYLQYTPRKEAFLMETRYNPVRSTIWIEGDTLDAKIPAGTKIAGLDYTIKRADAVVTKGHIGKYVYYKYQDLIQMPPLAPGKYDVVVDMVDKDGKTLVSRTGQIEKKDEAKQWPEWWGKTYGNPEQLLKPFEPLRPVAGKQSRTAVSCVRRTYEFDSLGLPIQIEANGGPVLTGPARIVLIVDDEEYVVPTKPQLPLTEQKDWRVSFKGAPTETAGVRFSSTGMMEQDGLVTMNLTYEPVKGPVAVQELRIEWPVDDAYNNHLASMGVGGNFSARSIGVVPPGQGVVWTSKKNIGKVGSGMAVGNFMQNLWVGTELRGLLWHANSDEGWVPNDAIAAHDVVRTGTVTTIRNHLIGTYPGQSLFILNAPRTLRFSYNASPFKKLTKGWRINLRSAANGFSEKPKYKWNWDTGQEFFSILSPPFPDTKRWPEYYAWCKQVAEARSRAGLYGPGPRMRPYLTNQIAVRGYMSKTVERGLYNYFGEEWNTSDSGESLNKTYRDYMMYLQHRQVTEGGCRHFYYDISMCGRISRAINAGFGYILPDGRIQPSGTDGPLRRWYIRANALMQDRGLYPTGISGHCTNTVPLTALPFADALLDSEFPMQDPITVFPSDRMIALSCPESFGCNINHLGFMNPAWAAMHDAGMGGGHGSVFDRPEWRNWGIEREDVQFIPYWRNGDYVRRIGDGLITSMWKRPGSVILEIMNHGPDPKGFEKTRPCEIVLNLRALGVPRGLGGERVRVSEITRERMLPGRYLAHLKWYQDLPGTPNRWDPKRIEKFRPDIAPRLDLRTGTLTGFDVWYHDQRIIVINWDAQPIRDAAWKDAFTGDLRAAVLDWGISTAAEIEGKALADSVKVESGGFAARAWKRPGSVLIRLTNPGKERQVGHLKLDLAALGVKVAPEALWRDFTSIYNPDGKPVSNVVWDEIKEKTHYWNRGTTCFDGWLGKVVVMLQPGETRVFCIDKY